MKAILVGVALALALAISGLSGIRIAGDTWPGGNGPHAQLFWIAGDTWPGGN